jgi:glycyl-tRNA synthetase
MDKIRSGVSPEEGISIEDISNFCKRKGFVFRSSEIYGGFSGFWDFGPLGAELFNNLKASWWNYFVHQKNNMTGIDASIISHPRTWKASGHLANFNDMMIYCKKHKKNFRVDHLVNEIIGKNVEGMSKEDILKIVNENRKQFEKAGYDFNNEITVSSLMFKTEVGPSNPEEAYLRGETAQAMFMDFKLVADSARMRLPFGIAQIGRCFRNEIAPRDFLFRSREFNIGEFEFFIHPDENKCNFLTKVHLDTKVKLLDSETQEAGKDTIKETTIGKMLKENRLDEWHAYWLAEQIRWYLSIGLTRIKIREHMKSELSHYSSATFDLDYEYPFGSKELGGIANRGQYDLNQHTKESGAKLELFDEATRKSVIPRVIEPTFGMERAFLAVLCEAYEFNKKRENIVLHLNPKLAPVKAAIFPLIKEEKMIALAKEIFCELSKEFNVQYDESASVGRRYSRQDEQGTPYCITVDQESLKKKEVTVRDRDSTKQISVKIKDLRSVIRDLINGEILFSKAGKSVETRVKK